MRERVVVAGPVSWNHLVYVEQLPEPVAHTQGVKRHFHTVGGTSAGKSLHLKDLGFAVDLFTFLGDDAISAQLAQVFSTLEIGLHPLTYTGKLESHLNLMTDDGQRVSLYLETVPQLSDAQHEHYRTGILQTLSNCAELPTLVLDLTPQNRELLLAVGEKLPNIWTDLHDYDGKNQFHEPFVSHAEFVFLNADNTSDPFGLLHSLVQRGVRVAICTLGEQGAIAVDENHDEYQVVAAPIEQVADTNGAGDAFFAGFLSAHLAGADILEALKAGTQQALVALRGVHLHPSLAPLVGL